ncbi:hypothetical protein [Paraflavitalea pollutisoli]|uniref:hypothetical protein n=1 Tax=Paraflavitalea pollutisoli TaxID=3034143 RepID=UPI0023ED6506|nr:hypothetical protein [Paraflavitalea sp. H1-2-19X]
MNTDSQNQFILALIKQTNSKNIEWSSRAVSDPELANGEIVIDKVYSTEINGKRFNLYRYKYKHWKEYDEYEWNIRPKLELVDMFENVEFEFNYDYSLEDLYQIVRQQSSGILEFIEEFISTKLEITYATYGIKDNIIDVTNKIRNKVLDDKLRVYVTNELGSDPAPGKIKELSITYKIGSKQYVKKAQEGTYLEAP